MSARLLGDVDAAQHARYFVDALEKGIFDWSRAVNLADVVSGRAGIHRRDRITLFKSVGLAIEARYFSGANKL